MHGRFPILYIAEADAEDAVLSSGALAGDDFRRTERVR